MAESELNGSIRFMSLGMLISINCNELRTIRLNIRTKTSNADIFIEKGNIVHAVFGIDEGKSAFQKILALKEGTFNIYPDELTPKHSIRGSWAKLLFESTRLLDEKEIEQKTGLDWSELSMVDIQHEPDNDFIHERLVRMINALQRLQWIRNVTVLVDDTQIMHQHTENMPDIQIEHIRNIKNRVEKLTSLLGANNYMHAIIKSSQNTFLINHGYETIIVVSDPAIVSEVLIEEIYLIMKRYR